MQAPERKPLKAIGVKINEEQARLLERLMRDTGLSRSSVIKLAITELATRRGLRPGPCAKPPA